MLGDMTTAPRIVPFGAARLLQDRMANGHPAMRVTQRFNDLDAYFGDRIHGAMDIANFYCGDALYAPISGQATQWRDPNGALGIRITAGSLVVELWHLSKFSVAHGASVTKNQTIVGLVGSTGLDIAGCHVHVKASTTGGQTWRDPWPLLDQNSAVRIKFNATTGINVRTGPGTVGNRTAAPLYATLSAGRILRLDGKDLGSASAMYTAKRAVLGASHGIGARGNDWTPVYLGGAYRYVASPLVTYI